LQVIIIGVGFKKTGLSKHHLENLMEIGHFKNGLLCQAKEIHSAIIHTPR
jgi:hypothetical protein